ncbi:uncharacterized protein LAESUDRAFT_649153 [Laetiporus sulphureus 93-53]|uniref:Uncharacterized protein n=1 Tax=Laetiporus sulphureus 93-53 TaxID=1314785 RepID=A0A165F3B2_9APHY|nr:uncharacterized protein LAESUDRAFT_649153 [Laetiporus sulphureus 93-53]KZT08290.1 hypothetical protein LAESUDRAFT_649153 [Laetiporus sulphureus 93-53]
METSDGETVLRQVQAKESEDSRRSGTRGPRNEALPHWTGPKAILDPQGGKRWLFVCKHCDAERTVVRQADEWKDERRKPVLGNLTTHTNSKHVDTVKEVKAAKTTPQDGQNPSRSANGSYTPASARLMEKFLEDGRLNPKRDPTQKGFLRVFAAWLLEENLPFTTGEAPGLHRLFHYLGIKFILPTDTTVRNTLARIFADLHAALVKELAAINGWVAARDKLEALTLTPSDWNLLQQLCEILGAFTVVTRHMSLADTPTLPWVLPMYHHMQGTLEQAIATTTLSSIKRATTAGLSKLNAYFVKALDCQHNVIATGKLLGEDRKERAWTIFEYVFQEYEKTGPKVVVKPQMASQPITQTFLDTLTSDVDFAADTPVIAESELERWKRGVGGKGDPYAPLIWWKVILILRVFKVFCLCWLVYRLMNMSFLAFLIWLEISLPFLVQVSQLNICFLLAAMYVPMHAAP